MNLPKLVGLTGGIASGKSTVADFLRDEGYSVIDADKYGHKVLETDQLGYQKAVQTFGKEILNSDRSINRAKLGAIVFSDFKKLEQLNKISHPLIANLIRDDVAELSGNCYQGIVFLEAALLIEAEWHRICQQIWVVMLEAKLAIVRLQTRNRLSRSEAQDRLDSQMKPEERLKFANIVLHNDGALKNLEQQINKALSTLHDN